MSVVVDSEKSMTIDRDGDFWWAGYYGTYWAVSPEADLVGVVFSQNEPGPYSDTPLAPGAARVAHPLDGERHVVRAGATQFDCEFQRDPCRRVTQQ